MKKTMCIMMLLLSAMGVLPQDIKLGLKKVNIGDDVSSLRLSNIFNYTNPEVKVSDFKGKILILDFWSFGCAACVASWPKIMHLQNQFNDKIQIITINPYKSPQENRDFIARYERVTGVKLTLPVVCNNKDLLKLFPHQFDPHVIFINANGVVEYISNGSFLNHQTITNMINNKKMIVHEKTDEFNVSINPSEPLFVDSLIAGQMDTYSFMSPYMPKLLTGYQFGQSDRLASGWIANYPIKPMLQILFGREVDQAHNVAIWPASQFLFDHNVDTTKFVDQVDGITQQDNGYCLQQISRIDTNLKRLKQKMLLNVLQNFGLATEWKMMNKQCLVISRGDSPIKSYDEGGRFNLILANRVKLNKISILELINAISNSPGSNTTTYPIVDETDFQGLLGLIEFDSERKLIDYKVLTEKLAKYGLKISLQERIVKVLVVKKSIEPLQDFN